MAPAALLVIADGDERILNGKRHHRDRPRDVQAVPSAAISDLSRALFLDTYLPSAVAEEVLAANERSFEERLVSTKMIVSIDEPVPTVPIGARPSISRRRCSNNERQTIRS